ncbi:bifunctional precorrin-2 dehydrogenase/sirohydrochlorin ferrochelatase [Chlorobium sp. BLA1]|uniref:precorrin-2 dehydrogenase/sirohydrochlorin ferrochelatase family protein n=1 Tax=Candidatus Chlorobium masyuteum TaxID=2716876 RepID=UPI00142264A5|nr:bifunctional precorrin-2 dehydrogenase/sirohydrochlorin ferrochelatase [Candidatus Chlorobium masyuteum]NHQ60749.1 bifunctional precorrin-2 dehydrogenase/sirohydrochlorin ferrochelatase [Candidatus Chlorobium masyuteum]
MSWLPICLKVENKQVLILGGGKAALEKIQMLLRCDVPVTVVGEEIDDSILQSGCNCHLRPFLSGDLEGVLLVYACNRDREVNRLVKEEANARGILVNTPDDPELCDFITPALFIDGPMMVAVSSGGTDVRKAVEWRNRIKTYFSTHDPIS